jgi:hypothetical protein
MSVAKRAKPTVKTSCKINWDDEVKPFGERLGQSLEYLKFRVRNFNAVAAYEQVRKFVSERQKYLLFQKYFPNEWKNSRTSFFKTGVYENYTERTNEFFELVNQHLFPLLSGWNEDPETDFDNFNIFSLNVDFCCEDIEYENLRVSFVAALLFFSGDEEIWEFLTHNYHISQEDFPEINRYSFDKIWNLEKTGRIGLYLTIFEVIDHSTGNPWLDTTNCHYNEYFSWNEQTVELLTKSYREAQEILEKIEILDALIEANPKEILGEMISLWNTGQIPKMKSKRLTNGEKEITENQ